MRRTSKFRGHRTHGRGKRAGRGAGKRGGRGNAGLHKHKYIWMLKYDPDHFGRRGFKRHPSLITRDKTINIKQLEAMLPKLLADGKAREKGGAYTVDLKAIGYDKLLGTGRTTLKMNITVTSASVGAVEKVKGAGGSVESQEVGTSISRRKLPSKVGDEVSYELIEQKTAEAVPADKEK